MARKYHKRRKKVVIEYEKYMKMYRRNIREAKKTGTASLYGEAKSFESFKGDYQTKAKLDKQYETYKQNYLKKKEKVERSGGTMQPMMSRLSYAEAYNAELAYQKQRLQKGEIVKLNVSQELINGQMISAITINGHSISYAQAKVMAQYLGEGKKTRADIIFYGKTTKSGVSGKEWANAWNKMVKQEYDSIKATNPGMSSYEIRELMNWDFGS